MPKIITVKLELVADEDVATDAVKAVVQAHVRTLGTIEGVGTPGEGQATVNRAVHFGLAQAKTWQPPRERKGK